MFKNLTSQQKIMFVLLGIVALICLVLVLYFALSKKSCPNPPNPNKCTPPSLVKFAISKANPPSSIPWITPTYYRYSYYFTDPTKDGLRSDYSLPVVAPTGKETNPIIEVILLTGYNINVYRALDDGTGKGIPGTFSLLNVTVNSTGQFTDTNNPSPSKAPDATIAPQLKTFNKVVPPNIPWLIPTYYRYSYYITDLSTEGGQSPSSTLVVGDNTQTNPIIQVTLPPSGYNINVYRALDDGTGKGIPGTFSLLNVTVNSTGQFTDTNNPSPSKAPDATIAPQLKTFNKVVPPNIPWLIPTYYRYSYYITDLSTEGAQSPSSTVVVSPDNTKTLPMIQVTLSSSQYKINVYRALDDGTGKPGTFSLLNVNPSINLTGNFTDYDNPTSTIPPKPSKAPKNNGWGG